MHVSLRDVNVPSPGLENWGNVLCYTRFTHTMSMIHLAGLQDYATVLSRSYQTCHSLDLCLDSISFSALAEVSSELRVLGHNVYNG